MASNNNESPPCRLLSLPPELRDMIYEFVFVSRAVSICHAAPKAFTANRRLNTGLLLTCKQLRQETRLMYYAKSTFFCSCKEDALEWLVRLPADAREALRHVVVRNAGIPRWMTEEEKMVLRNELTEELQEEARKLRIDDPENVFKYEGPKKRPRRKVRT